MAIAFRQSRSTTEGASPRTLAYSSAVASGSLLVAYVFWLSATETMTFSDSVNGSWTAAGGPQTGVQDAAGIRCQMFYFANTGAGTPTCTATRTGTVGLVALAIHEYTGIATASPQDTTPLYGSYQNDTTVPTGSITNATPDAVIFSGVIAEAGTMSVDAPFTVRETGAGFNTSAATADRIVSASDLYACTYENTPGGDHTWGITAFKMATAAPSGSGPRQLLMLGVG